MEPLAPADFDAIHATLRKNAEAIAVSERRKWVSRLSTALQSGDIHPAVMPLVQIFAADPRPEVRTDVAELLVWTAEDDFLRLTAQLAKDNNAYVRRAAERALDRRRKGKHEAERRQRGIDAIRSEYDDMEKLHGKVAAEKARDMAERLYDVMVGSTVHNMRALLAPAKMSAATLAKRVKDSPPSAIAMAQTLNKMVERLALLERMLSNMRAYSRTPSTKRRSERVVKLVQEAVGMLRENLKADGKLSDRVAIEVEIDSAITLPVAKDAIVMALYNLLHNSYEAFPADLLKLKPGTILIRAHDGNDGVRIEIADNGMGMDAEQLEAIRQVNPGHVTLKRDGTGFGLPIAHRYVTAHGGSLSINSKENKGTTVTLIFPRDVEEADE